MYKKIEIELSKLKDFQSPKIKLEQYSTPPKVIKEFLLFIEEDLINLINKKIEENKILKILDCCAGTGFLGISIILFFYFLDKHLLKNLEITFIEKDKEAFKTLKENLNDIKTKFKELKNVKVNLINKDFFEVEKKKFDLIVMNPPFGIQGKMKDKEFVEKALELSNLVYSFHSANSLNFFEKRFNIADYTIVNFPLKQQFWFHNKKKKEIDVIILKILGTT
jgi:putative methylase